MKQCSLRQVLVLVCTTALLGPPATAGDSVAYSFTSGPWGDGFMWPTAQFATQGPSGGIVGDPFTTPHGITFYHLAGNPAFFDANNYQTAPANGIVGDAWWTNARSIPGVNPSGQPFTLTAWMIDFFNTWEGSAQNDFGFNLAFAQPTLNPPAYLEIEFGDAAGFSGNSRLYFDPNDNDPWQQSAGNFVSAQQPVGREAQFWFPLNDVRELIVDQNSANQDFIDHYGSDNIAGLYIDILYLSISFHTLNSPNNTTQLAMDNFIYGAGAKLPDMPALQYRPEFTLDSRVKFQFDKPTDPDSSNDISILFDEIDALLSNSDTFNNGSFVPTIKLSGRLAEAVDQATGNLGLETAMTQTMNFEALKAAADTIRNVLGQNGNDVELSLTMDRLAADADRIAMVNATRAISQIIKTAITADVSGPDGTQTLGIDDLRSSGGSLLSAANDIATRLISMQVNGSVPLDGLDPGSNQALAAIQSILSAGTDIGELMSNLKLTTYDPETDQWVQATELNSDESGEMFNGVSAATYEAMKALDNAMMILGDHGSNITNITFKGTRIEFTAEAWAVVDHNSFYRIELIPEPGSLVLLAAVAPLLLLRRGCGRS